VSDRSATVGETRAWLEAAYGVPRSDRTHFVIVARPPSGLVIAGCCDGTDETGMLLATALRAVAGEARVSPESGSVIVSRDDLRSVLGEGFVPPAVRGRLAEAAGVRP
jgi:hypothetical protein